MNLQLTLDSARLSADVLALINLSKFNEAIALQRLRVLMEIETKDPRYKAARLLEEIQDPELFKARVSDVQYLLNHQLIKPDDPIATYEWD